MKFIYFTNYDVGVTIFYQWKDTIINYYIFLCFIHFYFLQWNGIIIFIYYIFAFNIKYNIHNHYYFPHKLFLLCYFYIYIYLNKYIFIVFQYFHILLYSLWNLMFLLTFKNNPFFQLFYKLVLHYIFYIWK